MLLCDTANRSKFSELKIKYNPNLLSSPITCSKESVAVLRNIWDKALINIQEQVYILFLNGANQVICYRCLNTGSHNQSLFDLRLALACALGCLAGKVIIAHNHPSGQLRPSAGDLAITNKLKSACRLLDIELIDHIILNEQGYYSFVDNDSL